MPLAKKRQLWFRADSILSTQVWALWKELQKHRFFSQACFLLFYTESWIQSLVPFCPRNRQTCFGSPLWPPIVVVMIWPGSVLFPSITTASVSWIFNKKNKMVGLNTLDSNHNTKKTAIVCCKLQELVRTWGKTHSLLQMWASVVTTWEKPMVCLLQVWASVVTTWEKPIVCLLQASGVGSHNMRKTHSLFTASFMYQ